MDKKCAKEAWADVYGGTSYPEETLRFPADFSETVWGCSPQHIAVSRYLTASDGSSLLALDIVLFTHNHPPPGCVIVGQIP